MKNPKLTPWFPPEIKPVHVGVYRTALPYSEGFSLWNGQEWANQGCSRREARSLHLIGAAQNKVWRGLAETPKVAVPNTVKAKKGK